MWFPVSAEELLDLRADMRAGRLDVAIEPGTFSIAEHEAFPRPRGGPSISVRSLGRQVAAFDAERESGGGRRASSSAKASTPPRWPDRSRHGRLELPDGATARRRPVGGASVWRADVALGRRTVAAGDVLFTLEAMKLEIPVVAPVAGTVEQILVRPGEQVTADHLLAVVIDATDRRKAEMTTSTERVRAAYALDPRPARPTRRVDHVDPREMTRSPQRPRRSTGRRRSRRGAAARGAGRGGEGQHRRRRAAYHRGLSRGSRTLPTVSRRPCVERLLEAAGLVMIGKTNLDQFATGLVGTRTAVRTGRAALGPDERIAGGSSSGSAVAVALGIVDVALGTATAGSGRVPAAFNGIVGTKPTRGLVPTTSASSRRARRIDLRLDLRRDHGRPRRDWSCRSQ